MNRLACLPLLLAACAGDPDDTLDCDDGRCDQVCEDPKYDDGVCDLSLACDAPDLDCFRTFDDDQAAAAWFADLEPRVAALEGRPSRGIVPLDDPRYAAVRELLDRGWDAMRTNRPVAGLATHRPALLLVEDPTVNAFVLPEDLDQKRAAFAVMVHTGLLGIETTDDASLGLMMHELQHAVGLHVVAEVKERLATYYLAEEGYEPIGREQDDDAEVRELASRWRAHAAEAGSFVDANLRGMPLGGQLQLVLRRVIDSGDPTACAGARASIAQIFDDLRALIDPVSSAIEPGATFAPRIDGALAELRTCLPDAPSFVEVVASIAGVSPDQIEAQLSAEDRALIAGEHVVDAIDLLTEDRRAKMRAIEAAGPWHLVRYFSEEEDADDTSVPVLRAAGADPNGLGTFLVAALLEGEGQRACTDLLDAGEIPHYGVDLNDTHHGTCWRAYHIDQLAAAGAKPRRMKLHPLVERPTLLPRRPRITMY